MEARCQRVGETHPDEVWLVTWSPNGQHFATSGKDGTITIWNATFPGKECEQQHENGEAKEGKEEEEGDGEEGKGEGGKGDENVVEGEKKGKEEQKEEQEKEQKDGEGAEEEEDEGPELGSEEEGYFQDFMNPSSWTNNSLSIGSATPSNFQPEENDPLYFFPSSLSQTGANKLEMVAQQNLQEEYDQEEEKGWEGMGNLDDAPDLADVPPSYTDFFSECPMYTESGITNSPSPPSFPLSNLFSKPLPSFIEHEKVHTLPCGGAVTWHAWSPDSQFLLVSLLTGKVVLFHVNTGSQVLQDKALLDCYPQWVGNRQFLLCTPEERRRTNTEKYCTAKTIIVELPKGVTKGEQEKEAPPRVEYEKTCKKCKGASSTVVFELASNDYLRFLVGCPEVGYVAFVRDFSGHPMDEVVVMDEWWGKCTGEGARCVRNEKPRMNLRGQGQESNFPPLLRVGFIGSVCGIGFSPDGKFLAVVTRLFSGSNPRLGVAPNNTDPTTYKRIVPPSQIEQTASLRLKLLLSRYSSSAAPLFEQKVFEILDTLREHWLAELNKSNPDSETNALRVETTLQSWLISQYLSFSAQPEPPLKHYPTIFLIDLSRMHPVAYLDGLLDAELAIFENQCLFWPSFSPDSRYLLIGSGDASVCVYDLNAFHPSTPPNITSLQNLRSLYPLPLHLPSPSFLTEEEGVRRGPKREIPISRLKGHTQSVSVAAVHPTQGVVLSVSDDRSLCIWQAFEK